MLPKTILFLRISCRSSNTHKINYLWIWNHWVSANGKSFSFYRLYLQFIRNHNIFDGSKSIFWWFFFSQEWITKLGVTSWRKIILHLIKWMHFILGYTGIFGKCVVFHSNFDWNKNSIPPKKQLEPVAALMRFLAYSSENSNETLTRKKHTFKYGQRNKHSDD